MKIFFGGDYIKTKSWKKNSAKLRTGNQIQQENHQTPTLGCEVIVVSCWEGISFSKTSTSKNRNRTGPPHNVKNQSWQRKRYNITGKNVPSLQQILILQYTRWPEFQIGFLFTQELAVVVGGENCFFISGLWWDSNIWLTREKGLQIKNATLLHKHEDWLSWRL